MWQWIGLATFSLTLLPAGLALATNHVPRRLRTWLAPIRTRGWVMLLYYSAVPLYTIPRLAGFSAATRTCTTAGGILWLAGFLLLVIATHRHQNRAAETPQSTS
ncbi:hypothetical protein; putative membrane protein [Frankia alni ACN14a]|uniref:Uncharacterized protein n=1 Tax=Frankia alni (strain DSM 45986 / CECT 9034 / ACN14a) TaxID=326424 RepID=Q0RJP7_FRAAA|nr:hypothetical protein; putative membrane protein [Frankia alni ACN14a]